MNKNLFAFAFVLVILGGCAHYVYEGTSVKQSWRDDPRWRAFVDQTDSAAWRDARGLNVR